MTAAQYKSPESATCAIPCGFLEFLEVGKYSLTAPHTVRVVVGWAAVRHVMTLEAARYRVAAYG